MSGRFRRSASGAQVCEIRLFAVNIFGHFRVNSNLHAKKP